MDFCILGRARKECLRAKVFLYSCKTIYFNFISTQNDMLQILYFPQRSPSYNLQKQIQNVQKMKGGIQANGLEICGVSTPVLQVRKYILNISFIVHTLTTLTKKEELLPKSISSHSIEVLGEAIVPSQSQEQGSYQAWKIVCEHLQSL